ncbi:MAG: cation diffusion facilitator family transporter [Firmicutes bacterium]|nr:cation diffusion facilitator family transporter [Bacillota bacterium]
MTKLLLRLFVKNTEDPTDSGTRAAVGALSGIVGIVANLLLFTGKLIVGTLSGSVSITADAMNNLSDASSSIVTLIGFKLAEKPADEEHPYGHARFEYLSGLAVAAMIVIIGFELAKTSVEKILHPENAAFTAVTAAVLVGSIAVKLWLSLFNGKLGKYIRSSALEATAADSRNDCISTGAVLIAAVVEKVTGWHIDGWAGLAVALFILWSGAKLARETISPLLGESASPELRERIVDYISANPNVLGYHDLMVHDYGPGQRFATLHVEMDQRADPLACHEIIDDMERECLKSHNIHLVIHYDPVVTDDPVLNRLREETEKILSGMDPRLRTHDFRMVEGDGHRNLIFDIALPQAWTGREKEIRQTLETRLTEQEGRKIYTVITFDPAGFNA